MLTPEFRPTAETEARQELQLTLRRPVQVTIDQFRVAAEEAPDAAQLAVARGGNSERGNARIAERLALVAGVPPHQVLVDRVRARAMVRAQPLPGADLASYRALEQRVAAVEPRWTVTLIPPAGPLPDVEFQGEAPTPRGREAIATAAWAAQRLGLTVDVTARRSEQMEAVIAELRKAGVTASAGQGSAPAGAVALSWMAPGQQK